uniref:DUF1732 domain-containing protein n=1 Tax=candidate division WOR-3 bacterium TaxID=2052148 RepID=A0A7C4UF91_UNCW3
MKSMTGFGRATKEINGITIICELTSLNNKYLETIFNIPEEIESYRMDISEIIKKYIRRGIVDVKIEIRYNRDKEFKVDKELLSLYIPELKSLIKDFSLDERIDLKTLFLIPNIFKKEKFQDKNIVMEIVEEAIKELLLFREKEGENIKKSIEEKVDFIRNEIENIMFESKEALKDKKEDVYRKLLALKELGLNFAKEDIEFLGFRGEIDEEIIRLKSHIELLKETIYDEKPAGRRIGFIIQEIMREINTIGSKAILPGTVHRVIKIKEVVEEIREQSMNIE